MLWPCRQSNKASWLDLCSIKSQNLQWWELFLEGGLRRRSALWASFITGIPILLAKGNNFVSSMIKETATNWCTWRHHNGLWDYDAHDFAKQMVLDLCQVNGLCIFAWHVCQVPPIVPLGSAHELALKLPKRLAPFIEPAGSKQN